MRIRTTLSTLAGLLLSVAQLTAVAQDFPARAITLVAPFPAGSVTDAVTRILAQGMQEQLGQSVIVENRAGAQGTVGAAYVARTKPDGYTLLVASSGMFVAKSLFKTLSYEPMDNFQLVSGVGSTSMMFVVADNSPLKTIDDLTRSARSGAVNVGFGSPSGQLALSLYANTAKVTPTPIAYKGIPQALTDLAGGHVNVAVVDLTTGLAQVNSGKMRALAISAAQRFAGAPNIPTLDEAFPNAGNTLETLIAISGPAGIPADVLAKLDRAILATLAKPEVRTRFQSMNIAMAPLSTNALVARVKSDNPKWEALIKRAGIQPE